VKPNALPPGELSSARVEANLQLEAGAGHSKASAWYKRLAAAELMSAMGGKLTYRLSVEGPMVLPKECCQKTQTRDTKDCRVKDSSCTIPVRTAGLIHRGRAPIPTLRSADSDLSL
jgi:hypothetical protein